MMSTSLGVGGRDRGPHVSVVEHPAVAGDQGCSVLRCLLQGELALGLGEQNRSDNNNN